jgi:N4-gp56 family major capsid protein
MSTPNVLTTATTYGVDLTVKTTYDRELLDRAIPNLVWLNFGVRKDIPARGGTTIEIRRLGTLALATTALTEGSPPSAVQATWGSVNISVAQYGQWTDFSDLIETQAYDDVIGEYVRNFGETMGKTLDIVGRDLILAGITQVQYAGVAANRASLQMATTATKSDYYFDSAEIQEAVNTMKRLDVKPYSDGKFYCIVHPDTTLDLFNDTDIKYAFKDAMQRGGSNPLFTGVLGDYMGVRFVETTHAPSAYISTATKYDYVYRTVLFGSGAYAVSRLSALAAKTIIHPRGTGGHADPLEQASQVGWKAALGAGVLDATALVSVEHLTSTSAMNT